ncbi:MAG: hypothetical protein U0Y68_26255 [Blastocatellia bacterium]
MSESDYPGRFWPITWNCALRFDGYRYAETCGNADNGNSWLYDVAQAFVETHSLSADPLENWAVFFSLQRRIGHAIMIEPEEKRAFLMMFIHLYQESTPAGFIKTEYQRQWERDLLQAETVAQ